MNDLDNETAFQAALIAEQLARFRDQQTARMDKLEMLLQHHQELDQARHDAISQQLTDLRQIRDDHEARLRTATEGVTQFKTWSGLAAGGSSILSIVAFLKAFFGA